MTLIEYTERFTTALPRILAVLSAITTDKAATEDAAMDAYLKGWASLASHRHGSLTAWLTVIAKRCLIDNRRAAHADREHPTDVIPDTPYDMNTDTPDRLTNALAGMTPFQRSVVINLHYHGYSTEETARIIGATRQQVLAADWTASRAV